VCVSIGNAQQSSNRENSVNLTAYIAARSPLYTRVAAERSLLFEGDPLIVEVMVTNNTSTVLRFEGGAWPAQLALLLQARRGDVNQSVTVWARPIAPLGQFEIAARSHTATSIALDVDPTTGTNALPAGTYRLSIRLDAESLPTSVRNVRNILNRDLDLEVRTVGSQGDELDRLLGQAYFASRARRYSEVRDFANRVLAAYPNSIPALVDIAQSWRSQNRCREGAPALRQAIDLLAGTGDPLLVQPFPESYRSTLEAWMARCERESAGR
jgi:hypothetical protein